MERRKKAQFNNNCYLMRNLTRTFVYFIFFVNFLSVVSKGREPNNSSPKVKLSNYKMFSEDRIKIISNDDTHEYEVPKYYSELEFQCNSSYPTKWVFSENTYEDDNLQDIPKVSKTRIPEKMDRNGRKNGPFLFFSTVLLKFKKTESLQNFSCQGINNNYSSSVLNTPLDFYSIKIFIFMSNKTSDVKYHANRFGKNINCSLSVNIHQKEKKFRCLADTTSVLPKIIECNNPDECDSFSQKSKCLNQIIKCDDENTNCSSTTGNLDLVKYTPKKPGVFICDNTITELAVKYFPAINHSTIVLNTSEEIRKNDFLRMTSENGQQFYEGQSYKFVCNASMLVFAQGILWALGTDPELYESSEIRNIEGAVEKRDEATQFYTSTVMVNFSLQNDAANLRLVCYAPPWNAPNDTGSQLLRIKVLESYHPTNITIYRSTENYLILCKVSAQPPANISWHIVNKDNQKTDIPSSIHQNNCTSESTVENELSLCLGFDLNNLTLECRAINFKGNISKQFKISPKLKDDRIEIIICTITIVVFILIVIVLFFIYKIKKQNAMELTEADVQEFESGIQNANESNNNPILLPYNVKFEIPRERFSMEGGVLGSGFFGIVKKGRYDTMTVAIKTIKKSADVMHFKALLSELKIMCHIGNHPNLVNLVGACTRNIRKQEVYIVVEFCCNGNLLTLLRKRRDCFVDHYNIGKIRQSEVHYVNADGKKLSTKDLVRWSAEIACGMTFLTGKNVVHGDLATRNVLISEDMTAKLCDFGLSKQLYDYYSVYVQKPQKPLPLKWMAIESLRDLEFSLESDIWSFGVTIWEIFSLGQSPYTAINWDYNSWNLLEGGYRMSQPEFCNDAIYNLMMRCWAKDPTCRTRFENLRIELQQELSILFGVGQYTRQV